MIIMKSIKRIVFIALSVIVMSSSGYASGFNFGVKAGANFNKLHFNKEIINDIVNTENQTGFNAGVMAEFIAPVIGIGVDASIMYVYRPAIESKISEKKLKRDYIEIPLNLKYKLSLPAVEKIIAPYVFTGPSFAFNLNKTAVDDFIKSKKCDIAWNLGIGVEIIKHIQVGASYGWGLTKLVNTVESTTGKDSGFNAIDVEGRNNCWNISVAYLF